MKKLLLILMAGSLFGDNIRYLDNGMVLIKKNVKYLGVQDGYIYCNEKRAFSKQKIIKIKCEEVSSVTFNNNYMPNLEFDCSMDTYGVTGCIYLGACNYNPNAGEDDGTCIYPKANYDCSGNCISEIDCAGICGGIAVDDCEGICGGSGVSDCAGVCHGDLVKDICGNCGGDETIITNCIISELDNAGKTMLYTYQKKNPNVAIFFELFPISGYAYSEKLWEGIIHRSVAISLILSGTAILSNPIYADDLRDDTGYTASLNLQQSFAQVLVASGAIYWLWGYYDVVKKTKQYNNKLYKTIFGEEPPSYSFKLQPTYQGANLTMSYSFN